MQICEKLKQLVSQNWDILKLSKLWRRMIASGMAHLPDFLEILIGHPNKSAIILSFT
jgi:hypothetical protein